MAGSTARVPTASGAKYLQQLCKHWAHKLDVTLGEGRGVVRFPDGLVTLEAAADRLTVAIEADSAQAVERLKGVVERHLDRFAHREAPLAFAWS